MSSKCLVVLCTLIVAAWSTEDLTFPPGFKFGVATSSYQVEGAWNVDGKSESIWDKLAHESPQNINDRSNGDVACDSYNQWERDVEMAAELGVNHYRISISWPRILPNGFPCSKNQAGIDYYNKLINALLEKNIEPMVTLYHWDMPLNLQTKYSGWLNPLISDWFADYARVAFELFGDRVKYWITLNEPIILCDFSFTTGLMAPGIADPDLGPYLCNKNVLLAHAKAYRVYDKEFRHKQHGQVTIVNQLFWFEAQTEDEEELAALALQNSAGRYSHPIYSQEGGWPPSIQNKLHELGQRRGLNRSLLPEFTREEIELIRGTYDYYGLNHYTSRVVRYALPGEKLGLWPSFDCPDLEMKVDRPEEWEAARGADWLWIHPEGLRKLLVWLKKSYGDINIVITENGFASAGSNLNDVERIKYHHDYMEQMLLAIKEDGVNVTMYTVWSLMDNYEWLAGYESKFGLYEVDFNSPKRTRTPRESARYYADVIKAHAIVPLETRDEL